VEKAKSMIEYDIAVEPKFRALQTHTRNNQKSNCEKIDGRSCFIWKALAFGLKGYRSLRFGDYCVIYKIMENRVVVFILDVGHRKQMYDAFE